MFHDSVRFWLSKGKLLTVFMYSLLAVITHQNKITKKTKNMTKEIKG